MDNLPLGQSVAATASAAGQDGAHPAATTRPWLILAGAAVAVAALYAASGYSYLLFHSLAELFSIVIACSAFVIVWNTRRFLDNGYLTFIGVAYLFVAGLDLVHTLAYKGMNVLGGGLVNPAAQLWVAARALESVSLLVAGFFIGRRARMRLLLVGFGVAFAALLAAILWWGVFPTCYDDAAGRLTAFKKAGEYAICLVLLASLAQPWRHRAAFDAQVLALLFGAILVTVASELAFTLYTDPYGPSNLIGHLLKVASFYLVYRALVYTALAKPYSLLFRELGQALVKLKRSNAELEQFARVASHDLQAPLATVTDYLRLLERTCGAKLDAEERDLIVQALGGAARMRELIEGILQYSRVERAGGRFEFVPCSDVVERVLADLRPAIEASGARVTFDPMPVARGDPQQLVQLFGNLVGNALKFRGDRTPEVHIGVEREDGSWLFSVRDNGIGMPPGARERLFSMFQRFHSNYPGSGIGLAICKKIAERHGGRIWAESEVGKGSTFFFTLPVAPDA